MTKAELLQALNELIAKGELAVWDPNSKTVLSDVDLVSAVMNGQCIQINMREDEDLGLDNRLPPELADESGPHSMN